MSTSTESLKQLLALAANATGGKWRAGRSDMVTYGIDDGPYKNVYVDDPRGGFHHVTGERLPYTVARGEGEECIENAQFIAACSPDVIAEIVNELLAAREEIARLNGVVARADLFEIREIGDGVRAVKIKYPMECSNHLELRSRGAVHCAACGMNL